MNLIKDSILGLLITVLSVGLTGCATSQPVQETDGALAFQSVRQAAPLGDQIKDEFYAVIQSPEQEGPLQGELPEPALQAAFGLESLGEANIALVAYGGVKNSSGYSIEISSIRLTEQSLIVEVLQSEPAEDEIVEPATTQPFHVVSLPLSSIRSETPLEVVFVDADGSTLGRDSLALDG